MDNSNDWLYPEGPGIVKSYDYHLSTGTYIGSNLTNHIRKSVGLPVKWEPTSNVHILAEVHDLERKVKNTQEKLAKLEAIKVKEFRTKDFYEVNKRIERLERQIALIESSLNNKHRLRGIFGEYGWLTPILWIFLALLSGWIYG